MHHFSILIIIILLLLFLLLPLFLLLSLPIPGHSALAASQDTPLRLAILSDLHYIAPELTDHGPAFMQVIANADGKVTEYCDELLSAFIEQIEDHPVDALILPGDLTFNGALQSHEHLAQRLQSLRDSGLPVYVIPGNHDVYNRNAAQFEGDHIFRVSAATSAQFTDIWYSFGFEQALSRDSASLSYTLMLSPAVRLLMVDVNTEGQIGVLTDATLGWIEQQLAEAQTAKQAVLAVSHQNLFAHNTLFVSGFQMEGAEKLAALYQHYGVLCNISGHMHIQHWRTDTVPPEIVVSSAAVSPCQFGLLTLYQDQLEYHTETIRVSDWAAYSNRQEPQLLQFKAYARSFFDHSTLKQADTFLETFPKENREQLLTYMSDLNAAYFSGNLSGYSSSDPAFQALTGTGSFWALYLKSILPDLTQDYTSLHHTFGGESN